MKRRTALSTIGSGIAVGSTGCLSVGILESGPVDFVLLNFAKSPQTVEVSIRDDEGVLLEGSYEIDAATPDEPAKIEETGFTEATNGEIFDVMVSLDSAGKTKEGEFRVECMKSDTPDKFLAEIREDTERDNRFLEFRQSECSSGR